MRRKKFHIIVALEEDDEREREGVEKLACKNLKRKFRDSHFSAARSMRKVEFDKDEREKWNVMPLIYGSRLKL